MNIFVIMYVRCYRKDGYLFDKESILEYILTKKREYARKLKEYEKQKQKKEVGKLYIY